MAILKLKDLRDNSKLSQQELADLLQVQRQNYTRWELNRNEPSIDMLIKIADHYGVSLDYLCNHRTENQLQFGYIDEKSKELIQLILSLNETNKENAKHYLNGLIQGQ